MNALPGAPFLARRGTELWLEDVRVSELAAEHGTPLYAYSRGAMRAALARIRQDGTPVNLVSGYIGFKEFNDFMGLPEVKSLEVRYSQDP